MKVERISAQRITNLSNNKTNKQKQGIEYDTLIFRGDNKKLQKPSFLERISTLFSKEKKLTPEKIRDNEIKEIISILKQQVQKAKKDGKYYRSFLDILVNTGKDNNFKMLLMDVSKRVLFGEISPDSNLPRKVTIIDMSKGMNVDEVFTMPNGLNSQFSYRRIFDDNTEIEYKILGTTLLSVTEHDTDTDEKRILIPTEKGFYYSTIILNKEGEVSDKLFEVNYNPSDWESSFFTTYNDEGFKEHYTYNPKLKMWILEKGNL